MSRSTSASGCLQFNLQYIYIYVWIFENSVKELNSRRKRAFFLAREGEGIKIKRNISPFFFLHSFIFLSLPSFLYFCPFAWLEGGIKDW